MRFLGFKAHVVPALAVLYCLIAGPVAGVSAQAVTSQSLVGGQTVAWDAPWSRDAELSSSGNGFDLLALETDLGLIGVGSYGYQIAGSDVRDIAIESFAGEVALQSVDRGDYDNVSYSLDIVDSDGNPLGLFTLVVESTSGTLLSLILAPVDAFQSQMEAAQAAVTIDGERMFEGVDASVMQGHLDSAAPDQGTTQAPDVPHAPTDVPAPTAIPSSGPDSGGGLVGGINASLREWDTTPAQGSGGPTPASGESTTTASPLPNGYTIPSNGVLVTWSDDWNAVEQNQESVRLESPSLTALLSVVDLGSISPGGDVRALAESIVQEPGFEGNTVVAAVALDSGQRNVIVLSQAGTSGSIYLIYDVAFSDQRATALLLTVFHEDLGRVVDAIPAMVQVDGQPVFTDFRQVVPDLFTGSGV